LSNLLNQVFKSIFISHKKKNKEASTNQKRHVYKMFIIIGYQNRKCQPF